MIKLSLYMVTHKAVDFIPEKRIPIFVGNGNNKYGFLADNTGINISEKNSQYCELTAYYWIWKNDHSSDYVSIEHYRRFFMSSGCIIPKIASASQLEQEIKNNDVITSTDRRFYASARQYYADHHYIEDLLYTEEAIKKFYPDFSETFTSVMNKNHLPLFNMIILSKKNFDKYCQWLFEILFYVEEKIDLSNRTDYQKRAFGFLAERLMEVWIEKNDLKKKKHAVYYLDSNRLKSIYISMKRRIPRTLQPGEDQRK